MKLVCDNIRIFSFKDYIMFTKTNSPVEIEEDTRMCFTNFEKRCDNRTLIKTTQQTGFRLPLDTKLLKHVVITL